MRPCLKRGWRSSFVNSCFTVLDLGKTGCDLEWLGRTWLKPHHVQLFQNRLGAKPMSSTLDEWGCRARRSHFIASEPNPLRLVSERRNSPGKGRSGGTIVCRAAPVHLHPPQPSHDRLNAGLVSAKCLARSNKVFLMPNVVTGPAWAGLEQAWNWLAFLGIPEPLAKS